MSCSLQNLMHCTTFGTERNHSNQTTKGSHTARLQASPRSGAFLSEFCRPLSWMGGPNDVRLGCFLVPIVGATHCEDLDGNGVITFQEFEAAASAMPVLVLGELHFMGA
eukprot:1145508-Amphidinium_carterae.1